MSLYSKPSRQFDGCRILAEVGSSGKREWELQTLIIGWILTKQMRYAPRPLFSTLPRERPDDVT